MDVYDTHPCSNPSYLHFIDAIHLKFQMAAIVIVYSVYSGKCCDWPIQLTRPVDTWQCHQVPWSKSIAPVQWLRISNGSLGMLGI